MFHRKTGLDHSMADVLVMPVSLWMDAGWVSYCYGYSNPSNENGIKSKGTLTI